jgi:hypothetical protein
MAGVSNKLPTPGSDSGNWGTYLNNFLGVSLVASTTSSTANGYLSQITVLPSSGVTSPWTLNPNPGQTVLANAGSGALSVILPDATATFNFYTVKKTDSTSNAVVVSTQLSQKIDGQSTQSITGQYFSLTFATDGANWFIV